jgi:diacylglycerol kinase family enzyme
MLFRGAALNLTVANGAAFGGGLFIAPGSRTDDGIFELIVIERMSRTRGLGALHRLRSGKHLELPEVHRIGGLRHPVEIRVASTVPAEADGESFTIASSLVVELFPAKLALLQP